MQILTRKLLLFLTIVRLAIFWNGVDLPPYYLDKVFLCPNLAYVWIWLMSEFGLCLNLAYVWFLLMSDFCFCLNSSCVWIHLMSKFFLCLNFSYIWIQNLFEYLNIFNNSSGLQWILCVYSGFQVSSVNSRCLWWVPVVSVGVNGKQRYSLLVWLLLNPDTLQLYS